MHKVIQTGDGSHSLYVEELNEHYHSIHGAIQESKHVFIEAGLKHTIIQTDSHKRENKGISILEIGLGTGLNALLTMVENQKLSEDIIYTALEAFPISADVVNMLNYPDLLTNTANSKENLQAVLYSIHTSDWHKEVQVAEKFTLHKLKNTLQQVEFSDTFDLVYFDAFGPAAQPEMWTEDVFFKLWNHINKEGILVTYCAKGNVKRTLKKIGFVVETLQGPPGKREMVRAIKNTE